MMHEKARRRHEANLRECRQPEAIDALLDQYADNLLRATEWDAGQWGFDSDRWMEAERVALARRGGTDYPREII